MHAAALLAGFILDLIFGDPRWLPHPVRWMGAVLAALEGPLRSLFPRTPGGEKAAGTVLVAVVVGLFTAGTAALLALCHMVSAWLALAVESLISYQMLACRCLVKESDAVRVELEGGSLEGARTAVSMIVGRDTQQLSEEGVAKAAVETIAENTSDGVIAPLFYLALGGAPLGVAYKAVNTLDSMVGYRNERYEHYGCSAARLDDVLNFVPARVAGVLMVVAAAITGEDSRGAWRVLKRDRLNHASPNSAHTEAACAGALGVQLGGGASYFGVWKDKPTIGDATRPVEAADITRAHRLLVASSILGLAIALPLSAGIGLATGGLL